MSDALPLEFVPTGRCAVCCAVLGPDDVGLTAPMHDPIWRQCGIELAVVVHYRCGFRKGMTLR